MHVLTINHTITALHQEDELPVAICISWLRNMPLQPFVLATLGVWCATKCRIDGIQASVCLPKAICAGKELSISESSFVTPLTMRDKQIQHQYMIKSGTNGWYMH